MKKIETVDIVLSFKLKYKMEKLLKEIIPLKNQ